jgi:hypothetical protein
MAHLLDEWRAILWPQPATAGMGNPTLATSQMK